MRLAKAELARWRPGVFLVLAAMLAMSGLLPAMSQGQLPLETGIFVSNRGDDHNDGSSPIRALRTINAALARAKPGDRILIEAGIYREHVVTVRGGAPGAEIVLQSFNGTARIDGSTLKWATGRKQNQGLVELRHPFVKLHGLAVSNSKNTGILLDANDLTIEDCLISDTQSHGISTETSHQTRSGTGPGSMIKRIVIKGNTVERAALSGKSQAISLIADGFSISGNIVRQSPKEGIDVWLGSRRGSVAGNTVYGNAAVGIYVDGAAYVSISGNTVYGNLSGIGISSEDVRYNTHDIWVFNNIVRDNRRDGIFMWDDDRRPGIRGAQAVLIAHNTLIGNGTSLRFSGSGNSGWAANNLGIAAGEAVFVDPHHRASIAFGGNVWLTAPTGFAANPPDGYPRLGENSPAIGKAVILPRIGADPSIDFLLQKDFSGNLRSTTGGADAGAFQFQR